MRHKTIYTTLLLFILSCGFGYNAAAQGDPIVQARMHADMKDYPKALEIYKKLYDQTPTDGDVYNEYLNVLIATKDYKEAEKLAEKQLSMAPQNPMLFINLGKVYLAGGKESIRAI